MHAARHVIIRRVDVEVVGPHGAVSGRAELRYDPADPYAVAFNRDGTRLAVVGLDGTIEAWETNDWREDGQARHVGKLYSVAFSAAGGRLACGCADGAVRLWDVATFQEVAELRGHGDYVHQVAFSHAGDRLLSASGDGTVRVWDTLRPQDR